MLLSGKHWRCQSRVPDLEIDAGRLMVERTTQSTISGNDAKRDHSSSTLIVRPLLDLPGPISLALQPRRDFIGRDAGTTPRITPLNERSPNQNFCYDSPHFIKS